MDRTDCWDTLSVSQSDGGIYPLVMRQAGSQAPAANKKFYIRRTEKMKDYKNDGRGLICLMGICGILAVVIAIIAFLG